jgi:two-component system phosphate regulon response regulator PhoB
MTDLPLKVETSIQTTSEDWIPTGMASKTMKNLLLVPTQEMPHLSWETQKERGMKTRNKLLIADDKQAIHDVITKSLAVLSDNRYDIIHAYDGKEALRLAHEELPDLILLDVLMPHLDGRDICKELKNSPETKDIKIVMLTGKGEQHDRVLGLQLGADDYITKPFSINYLARRIERLLEKK